MLVSLTPTILLILGYLAVLGTKANPLLLINETDLRLSTIIKQYKDWDFVVHADEPKISFLDMLAEEPLPHNPVTIFIYNRNRTSFNRPLVYQCLHFVVQENETYFLDYTRVENNIEEADIIIFFMKSLNLTKNYTYLYESGVDNANIAFFINRTMGLAIFFYNSPVYETDVREIIRVNDVPMLNMYFNEFTNFKGFPLEIGYSNCAPFVYKQDGSVIGVEFKILEIVLAKLNITPIYYDYTLKKDARLALITDVNSSILDCAIGCLSNNVRRDRMVSFSNALQYEPHITIYASSNSHEQSLLYALTAPLHHTVWICCILTLILLSITIKLLVLFERKNVSVNSILIPLRILLEQSVEIPSRSNALRFGLCTWILVGFSLSSSYKSKLTAALIMPTTREPERLNQLLEQGYHFISPAEDSSYLIELLQISTDPVEYAIGTKLEDTKIVCEAIYRTVHEHSAVIEERTVVRFKLWNECLNNLTKEDVNSLRRLERATTVNGHMWAMPKSAPYKDRISGAIEVLKSHGLIQKWYREYNITRPLPVSNSVRKRGDSEPLAIQDLLSPFVLLGFGCVIAGIAFIIESLHYSSEQKKSSRMLSH